MVVEQIGKNGNNKAATPALVGYPGNSSMIQIMVIQQYVLDSTVSPVPWKGTPPPPPWIKTIKHPDGNVSSVVIG